MARPKKNSISYFCECRDNILNLTDIGYHDFRTRKSWKFYRTQSPGSIHFICGGKGYFHVRNKVYTLSEGDVFLVPPDELVMYYPDERDPWQYYWFSFDKETSLDTAAVLGVTLDEPVGISVSNTAVIDICDTLFNENFSSTTEFYYSVCSSFLKILSVAFCEDSKVRPSRSLTQNLVSDIKNIMKANYSNPDFSVSDAANALYISHAYMCKVFKTETGITPVSYLINLRLENASRLLHENDYSIKDLADAVGFSDELYFMKRFKKRFGLTVKEYRKQFLSNGE